MDIKLLLIAAATVLAGFVLFFAGRLSGRYGRLRPNEAVTRAYEQYERDPALIYYTSGPDVCPRALMGIDRRYALASDLWKRRDFDPGTFRDAVQAMQSGALRVMQSLHGFDILDQQGRTVGTWFSVLDIRTTVKMLPDNRLRVDTPPLPPELP